MFVKLIIMAVVCGIFFFGLVLSAKLVLWVMIPAEERIPGSGYRNRIDTFRSPNE